MHPIGKTRCFARLDGRSSSVLDPIRGGLDGFRRIWSMAPLPVGKRDVLASPSARSCNGRCNPAEARQHGEQDSRGKAAGGKRTSTPAQPAVRDRDSETANNSNPRREPSNAPSISRVREILQGNSGGVWTRAHPNLKPSSQGCASHLPHACLKSCPLQRLIPSDRSNRPSRPVPGVAAVFIRL